MFLNDHITIIYYWLDVLNADRGKKFCLIVCPKIYVSYASNQCQKLYISSGWLSPMSTNLKKRLNFILSSTGVKSKFKVSKKITVYRSTLTKIPVFEQSSMTVTVLLASKSSTTVCEPMNPAPPVTKMFIGLWPG